MQPTSRHRTLELTANERSVFKQKLLIPQSILNISDIANATINQDIFTAVNYLPQQTIDLLIVDPPYNLTKEFNGSKFKKMNITDYEIWLESWFVLLWPLLKTTASVYVCGDWQSSSAIFNVMNKYLHIRNRITFE